MAPPPVPWGEDAESPVLRLVRSVGFRLALLSALLTAGTALAMATFLYASTVGYLDRQTDAAIRVDVTALVDRYREAGIGAVGDAVRLRLAEDVADETVYLLVDTAGLVLAGNLDRWPEPVAPETDWAMVEVGRGAGSTPARIFHTLLPGGERLIVGRNVADRVRLRARIGELLGWSAAGALAVALAGAWITRRMLLNRMQPVTDTAEAIAAGDLSRRIVLSRMDDEFDQLANTLNDMLDRLARAMDGIRQVSNAIAHDLRTPLARLRARLEDSVRSAGSEEELRAALDRGIHEIDGIIGIFRAILRIAEIESGARRQAFAPIDLAPLLADAAELYTLAAEERGLHLSTDIAAPLKLIGDTDMLMQAVVNLLDNALKFSPAGGTVRLAAALRAGQVEVAVSDQGPGIPAEERARVTERFYRAEASRGTPGSGLGLSLVAAVAALHGGALAFEDGPDGRGLAARLTLAAPAAGGDGATARSPQTAAT